MESKDCEEESIGMDGVVKRKGAKSWEELSGTSPNYMDGVEQRDGGKPEGPLRLRSGQRIYYSYYYKAHTL